MTKFLEGEGRDEMMSRGPRGGGGSGGGGGGGGGGGSSGGGGGASSSAAKRFVSGTDVDKAAAAAEAAAAAAAEGRARSNFLYSGRAVEYASGSRKAAARRTRSLADSAAAPTP